MKNKVYSYLGFARKAGNLAMGYNACESAMEKRSVKLLLLSETLAENSKKKFQRKAEEQNVPLRFTRDSEGMSAAVGRQGIEVFGILDPNLASAIRKQLDEDGQTPEK